MTDHDPFAAAPASGLFAAGIQLAEEAQQTAPEPKSVGAVSVDVKPNILPADTSPELGITLKADGAPPWITYRSGGVDDALKLFTEDATKLADLMSRVHRANTHFAAGFTKPASWGGNTGGVSAPPLGATEAPAWAPPKPHADFVYKTGVSAKNGKTWHAWMPPEKGDSRDAKFFYPN